MDFLRTLSLALLLAHAIPSPAAESPVLQARALASEAHAAREAQNLPLFLEKISAAAALRPDYPRLLVNLAEAQAANDQPDEAIATLTRLAALGVHSPVDKTAPFAALRARDDFKAVVARLNANLHPIGDGEIAFSLPGMTGLIEGIAWREKTGEFFFGDVHHRAVWVRSRDGKVRRFTPEDDAVLGVFGLAVDEERGALWAAVSAITAMSGQTKELEGAAGLAEFDLETGQLRGVKRVPADGREHVLGDLTLAADGTVFATDSLEPILWRLAPGAATPEKFIESPEFISLQGLALSADGAALFVADHANGVLRVDLATRAVRLLESPPNTTLLGLDGLALAPNGDLLAVQNGLRPMRVLALTLDAAGDAIAKVTVLESAHLTMASPSLGCVAGGYFVFVGNSGWSRFEDPEPKPTAPRPVPIFHTKLPTAQEKR